MAAEKIDGVLYDVDATIYDHTTKTVPPTAQATFRQLEVPAMPVTGRSLPLLKRLEAHGMTLSGLASLDGGATVMDLDKNEVVWEQWLTPEQVTEVIRKIGGKCLSLSTATLLERVMHAPDESARFSSTVESPSVFAVYPLERKEYLDEMLQGIGGIHHRLTRYNNSTEQGCIQVTSAGINKEYGVKKLIEEAGLKDDRLLAIGDDYMGDGPMFRAVRAMASKGILVAMGNADEALKEEADLVVAGVGDTPDGFTEAMRHYKLVA